MFVVTLTNHVPIEEIERHLEAHRAFLDKYYAQGVFLASGPREPRTGGIIIVSGKVSLERLEVILDEDPFKQHDLARYDIIEFHAVKHNPALAALI